MVRSSTSLTADGSSAVFNAGATQTSISVALVGAPYVAVCYRDEADSNRGELNVD